MSVYLYIKNRGITQCYDVDDSSGAGPGVIREIFWKPENPPEFFHSQGGGVPSTKSSFTSENSTEFEVDLDDTPRFVPRSAGLVDMDKKELTFFEWLSDTYLPYRRVYIDLLHSTWPGWRVHWTRFGYSELLHLIGYKQPRFRSYLYDANVLKEMSSGQQIAQWSYVLDNFIPLDLQQDAPQLIDELLNSFEKETSNQPNCLITLKTPHAIQDFAFDAWPGQIFLVGPALIPKLMKTKTYPQIAECDGLKHGLLIDTVRNQVTFWNDNHVEPELHAEMVKIWKGWTVFSHNKGLPYQYAQTGRDPVSAMMPFDQAGGLVKAWVSPNINIYHPNPLAEELIRRLNDLFEDLEPRYHELWKDAGERYLD